MGHLRAPASVAWGAAAPLPDHHLPPSSFRGGLGEGVCVLPWSTLPLPSQTLGAEGGFSLIETEIHPSGGAGCDLGDLKEQGLLKHPKAWTLQISQGSPFSPL